MFETLEGWTDPLDGVRRYEELPPAARRYVAFLEREVGIPVSIVGVGQRRDQVLVAKPDAPVAGLLGSRGTARDRPII